MKKSGKSRLHFRISIIIANALIILVLTAGILTIVFSTSLNSARYNMNLLFTEIGDRVQEKISTHMDSLLSVASLGAVISDSYDEITGDGSTHPALPFMRQSLDQQSVLYSVYYGKEDGTFLQLIKTRSNSNIIDGHDAPEGTLYILRSIENLSEKRIQHWSFLDSNWGLLGQREELNPEYDPRKRGWYITSSSRQDSSLSEAYLFHSLQQLGITGSQKLITETGVFGADMTLQDLNIFVEEEKPSSNGGILLFDQDKRLLAATSGLNDLFNNDFMPLSPLPAMITNQLKDGISAGGEEILSRQTKWDDGKNKPIHIILISPVSDFTEYLKNMRLTVFLFSLALLLVVLSISIIVIRRLTSILQSLAMDSERVKHFDFTGEIPMESAFVEFHQLAEGFHHMKLTIADRTRELDSSQKKLEKIVELGIAMAAEKDVNHLAELILSGAKELANADGGSVYLKGAEDYLDFKIVLNDSMGFVQGGTSGNPITLPPVALYNPDGTPNHHNVVTNSFHTGKTVNIEDAYNNTLFDFSGTKKFDEGNNYVSHSFLTIPLRPRGGEVMGALQLINAKDINDGSNISFSEEIQRFVEALSASAATSLYNRELLETQHKLFDSMIEFTAGAIDAKSQYTGGHCARVPKIALLLAEEAHKLTEGPLADFQLKSADQWRELKIGAWLHDCGKMTTPEFVVDKATKLETIYNRVHEIRTRFEVLLRDAEIDKLKSLMAGIDEEKAESVYKKREAELQKDFRFIAECNSGDKYTDSDDIDMIKKIGEQTWVRNFDDNVGLSWEEQARIGDIKGGSLPFIEKLLTDKPEHLVKRDRDLLSEYSEYGFTLQIPEYLYNRGEIYNLSIQRGTLNNEERYKINEHVIQTIIMLENLPLPDSLKKVPQYAGTHHEALKGTGYPLGLASSALSIPARIMAIADIFEALTASDRPYKKTKPLSQCLKILHSFKKDGHIDPILFDLFLTSGVYREYAQEFLKPEQIDEVDITEWIG